MEPDVDDLPPPLVDSDDDNGPVPAARRVHAPSWLAYLYAEANASVRRTEPATSIEQNPGGPKNDDGDDDMPALEPADPQ